MPNQMLKITDSDLLVNQEKNQNSTGDLPELPTISLVVPNYQGGATLAATLQSIVEQNYPKLELIVVDGGSTDNSIEVIKQFESHITWWVSEQDRGQSHAINKGFARCTGEVVNWLCSDDVLAANALQTIGKYFAESPEIDVVVGRCRVEYLTENVGRPVQGVKYWTSLLQKFLPLGSRPIVEQSDRVYIKAPTPELINLMPASCPIHQPSCFYRRKLLLNRDRPLRENLNHTMDIELFNYFRSLGACFQVIEEIISFAPKSGVNKNCLAGVKATYELEDIYKMYAPEWIPLTYWHRKLRYPLECFLKRHRGGIWLYLVGSLWFAITLLLAPFYGLKKVWALRWTRFV